MTDSQSDSDENEYHLPPWNRKGLFPKKPEGYGPYGWKNLDGNPQGFNSLHDLGASIEKDLSNETSLVWTPDSDYYVLPEEVPELFTSLNKFKLAVVNHQFSNGVKNSLLFSFFVIWSLLHQWGQIIATGGSVLLTNYTFILGALLLFLFGIHPLYESWRERRLLKNLTPDSMKKLAREAKFNEWVLGANAPLTKTLIAAIALPSVLLLYLQHNQSITFEEAGALISPLNNEWSRIFNAPLLHGNWLHLGLNLSAIWFLGRRVEQLMRWVHLFPIFIVAAITGALCSAFFLKEGTLSLGASGGIMGFLGTLLYFEQTHQSLVPRLAVRRLVTILISTLVIGLLGINFIDNPAHLGGLFAGLVYGYLFFPKTNSHRRPPITPLTRSLAWFSAFILFIFVVLTISRLLSFSS